LRRRGLSRVRWKSPRGFGWGEKKSLGGGGKRAWPWVKKTGGATGGGVKT